MNDYEFECTGKFVGMYTDEEVELNKCLLAECVKDEIDCDLIEDLLRKGADPLGATAASGWGLLEHIYGEIICELFHTDCKNLPRITELFLKHGMDMDHPRIPYDGDNSIHPMWDMAFLGNDNCMRTLRILLDDGMSSVSTSAMWWEHIHLNLMFVDNGSFEDEDGEAYREMCEWAMKKIMLCASYDHILKNDEKLCSFICCSRNDYDLHKFRKWGNFIYKFDTSRCKEKHDIHWSVVKIYEKATGAEVWKFGIGLRDDEY